MSLVRISAPGSVYYGCRGTIVERSGLSSLRVRVVDPPEGWRAVVWFDEDEVEVEEAASPCPPPQWAYEHGGGARRSLPGEDTGMSGVEELAEQLAVARGELLRLRGLVDAMLDGFWRGPLRSHSRAARRPQRPEGDTG